MRSLFFIPASKIKKIDDVKASGVDDIIIDFEDSILIRDREKFMSLVEGIPGFRELWYRIPVREDYNDEGVDVRFLKSFLEIGIVKLVIPKIISTRDFEQLYETLKSYQGIQLIIIIEHPRLLVEMNQILQIPDFNRIIHGLGLGSHDLMNFLQIEHSNDNLKYPRFQTLYLAKAYQKYAIDIASMNISDKVQFEIEMITGMDMGFEGKFLIHPNQYEWFKNLENIDNEDVIWAKKIMACFPEGYKGKEIEPFILDGQIVEKPHVERAQAILKRKKYEK